MACGYDEGVRETDLMFLATDAQEYDPQSIAHQNLSFEFLRLLESHKNGLP